MRPFLILVMTAVPRPYFLVQFLGSRISFLSLLSKFKQKKAT
ncbi:protein of unknown function [Shewanella benthica]|uniref:Uncharacterized protein n=1 Tax=Shewanella benthica TaxID=43661 RepID=A0A330M1J4_9GAMM|nr:protein of unknown function [Shewanella benthica]